MELLGKVLELLEKMPTGVLIIVLVSIVFNVANKARRQSRNQERDLSEDSAHNDYDEYEEEYNSFDQGTYTPQSDSQKYIQRKSISSNDMFPRGDSLRKTGMSAIFRRPR